MTETCIDHGLSGNKPQGYHQIRIKGKLRYVHRMAYAEHHNLEESDLPELIRHLCNNPRCINSLHLAPGTHQDNADDRVAAGRSAKTQPRRRKLSEEKIREVRARFKKSCRVNGQAALAREFGVSTHPISDIVRGIR